MVICNGDRRRRHNMRHPVQLRRSSGRRLLMTLGAAMTLAAFAGACGSSGHSAIQPGNPSTTASSTSPTTASTGPPTSSAPSAAAAIVIKNYKFVPADMTVTPGETVTVRNDDSVTHTMTAQSDGAKAFDTGSIDPGATATFTAPKTAGSYPFICSIHPFMRGTLTVS